MLAAPPAAAEVAPSVAVRGAESRSPSPRRSAADESLAEALAELAEVDDCAAESDLPPPSPVAKQTARDILEKVARAVPRDYAVSPWDDGAVIVYSSGGIGRRVSILCDSQGDAAYYVVRPDGRNDKGDRRPAGDIPLDFICGALRELNAPAPE